MVSVFSHAQFSSVLWAASAGVFEQLTINLQVNIRHLGAKKWGKFLNILASSMRKIYTISYFLYSIYTNQALRRINQCENRNMPFPKILTNPRARAAYLSGVRDTLLVAPSYLPFGLVCGVASVNAGMTTGASLALPAIVYAGSAQAVLLQFIQSNASLWVAILSGCVINLRLAVYSAAMAAKVRRLGKPQRMLVAAFLVDNTFAFMQARERSHPHDKHLIAYYAGTTTVFWSGWLLFCAIGIFAGNVVPTSWQLDFAIPLSFIAIAATSIRTIPMGVSALVGGAASVLLFSLPLKLGLIAACGVGLLAGLLTEKVRPNSSGVTPQ